MRDIAAADKHKLKKVFEKLKEGVRISKEEKTKALKLLRTVIRRKKIDQAITELEIKRGKPLTPTEKNTVKKELLKNF